MRRSVLKEMPTLGRTSINSGEDIEFLNAVKAIGRERVAVTASWTEAWLTFPALDALQGNGISSTVARFCPGQRKRAR